MIVALAGGVGGAKMAQGIAQVIPAGELSVIVNTADDFDLWGLRICPDLDTVMYTLAGIADPVQGWGVAGDTVRTLTAIAAYGQDPWFKIGDRDVATHVLRTERLNRGFALSEVTRDLASALGVTSKLLPMSDDQVSTIVHVSGGYLEFQEYFVERRQSDDVLGLTFLGVEDAEPTKGVIEEIQSAESIVICPSNPFVSVGPILAVSGILGALRDSAAVKVAVSPIIGGGAVKGPAAKMLSTLGHEVSALGIARLYQGIVNGFVIDSIDAPFVPSIESLGMQVLVTNTVMGGSEDRARFAREVLSFSDAIR